MIHVDTRQPARFEWVSHRMIGGRRYGCSRGPALRRSMWLAMMLTRLPYVEVLLDKQKATTIGYLIRAVGWFSQQGAGLSRIHSDTGSTYRLGDWRKACRALDPRPIRI
jgi:hypothetical protein